MDAQKLPPEIFDRKRRLALRDRAGRRRQQSFLWQHIADELADRLIDVSRTFQDVLIIGPLADYAKTLLGDRHPNVTLAALSRNEAFAADIVVIEEDRLAFAPASFDLIISAGTLDSVNDLPGALTQLRRCLRPDGLFLGHIFGAGTLFQLKAAMLEANPGAAAAHIHPQIDVRTAADLLGRAGFALPVVDTDTLVVRYSSWLTLLNDLRDMGTGNALAGARPFLGRNFPAHLMASWQARGADDARVAEHFVHIYLSGWAPSTNQPKPAKRGSGKVSLANILPTKGSPR